MKYLKTMTQKLLQRLCCHRSLYSGLCGSHGFAAYATGKPEVYVPMMVIYGVLAITG